MAEKIFDKETLLDLTVNFIPLGIIVFFIGVFAIFPYWGLSGLATGLTFAIMISMFVALAFLTYISGKAIAGDEKAATVYPQGQAFLDDATPTHEEEHDEPTPADADSDAEAEEEKTA
ncbi:DUF6684 family protein [Haloferacaceae archaeon DSL9]